MKKLLLIILIMFMLNMNLSAQAPVAGFTSVVTTSSPGMCQINFTDQSTNNPNYWKWSFNTNTSYSQNPIMVFGSYTNFTIVLIACNSYGCDTTSCVMVLDTSGCHACSTVTGINANPVENSALTIYPNPSNGNNISVSFPYISLGDYQVLNILGKVVSNGNIMSTDKFEINLVGIAKGCYFVKVQEKDRSYVGRFIKGD